ncbi:hypothetical protein BH24DEI2_BH24DEI2_18780 [soil metagenome]
MSTEVCHYRLSLRGKPVGSHTLSTSFRGRTALLGAKLMVQDRLLNGTVTQESKVHRDQFFSFSFQEKTVTGSDSRSFTVEFDWDDGLVKATRGGGDSAAVPYVEALEDPLGLLYHIRNLGAADTSLRVPLLGKTVLVDRLGETTLEMVAGEQAAYAYVLKPGNSYLYVATEPPHPILMMSQPFEGYHLDAQLVRIDEDEPAPTEAPKRRRSSRRRRRKK